MRSPFARGSASCVRVAAPAAFAAALLAPAVSHAHAIAGDRVFPATMAVDDPGVGDEMNFQFGHIKTTNDDGNDVNVNTASFEWDKLITSNLAFSVGSTYINQNAPDGGSAKGFDNLEVGLKYLAYVNPKHEFMVSVGVKASLGGTGAKSVSDSFSTISPAVFFGKGFGDLPDALKYLRPLAITGAVSPNYTTNASAPDSLDWGVTLQYSIPYLQSSVKNLGLGQPFSNLVPVVEFPMNTCTGGPCSGQTTGTINPGLLWMTRWGQFGVEAQIPVNRASGRHTGVLLQAHLYLDDLFPNSVGKPLIHP
ncbi:hypothetical protein [Burkholderia ambifaria]|uniref:Transporter n=1 Tax=Burkholderia ambifaria TaxID=152480 RepID=A0AA41JL49_9BURK|nr:hypothetical protein [Burkholderia ambifaria]MBR8130942.1 hypothetical protein [Burkholderia ambifaria]PRE03903.1 hypothetical protein C6P77_04000 [Burkholderia ambifaria]UEP50169.1 hypothetical protein LMA00_24505 [Burkholderia ambifaria]